jgi:hypothetical protein
VSHKINDRKETEKCLKSNAQIVMGMELPKAVNGMDGFVTPVEGLEK